MGPQTGDNYPGFRHVRFTLGLSHVCMNVIAGPQGLPSKAVSLDMIPYKVGFVVFILLCNYWV